MLEKIDPFRLRYLFDVYNAIAQEIGVLRQDKQVLRKLRRALFTTPLDRPYHDSTDIFPPLEVIPHPILAGKRVGLVASGGSGSLVTLCGVKRALEEAGVELAAISVCSGSAIWGSMIAAGFDAQQMVDECLRWMPRDIADMDWWGIAKFPWTLGKGFKGLARGEALERTLDRAFDGMRLDETPIPYYTILLNIDANKIEYFGSHSHPEVKLATMSRMAISLPLFVHPLRFGDHYYVDGGVVNIFPVEPLLEFEAPFDYFIGVNTILPSRFDGGEDITGWDERMLGILDVSRQLWYSQHIEAAFQAFQKIEDQTLLLEPLSHDEIQGAKFFEIILDSQRWPDIILDAYHHTQVQLSEFEG